MGKTVGIDLGTTNSVIAYLENGEPTVIPNAEGSRTTPSIVAITEEDRLVGQIAKRQAIINPENTVFSIKRLIGRGYNSKEIQDDIKKLPYKIVAADNGDARVEIIGKVFSPSEISGMILSNLKQVAEEFLGEPVSDAVITVPAYFNDSQRQATKDAGKIAGLNVLRIVNEPTAAALAYGLNKNQNIKIAVFDLGGGTFDISILELEEGVFEVLSTNGDTHLGGEDFDLILVDYLVKKFKELNNIDLKEDKMALQRLKEAAEKAKMELSSLKETEISLPFITVGESGPLHLTETITRAKFEEIAFELIERLEPPCRTALVDAELSVDEINEIILVGGMTRMPKVIEKVKEIFKTTPSKGVNPDEVVAMGAAIQAGVMEGDIKDIVLLDVIPLSLGVETAGGVFTKIIERNTPIPVSKKKIFTTAEDNQDMVNIHILQGEREMAEDNISLARFQLVGILPAPRAVPQIEVSFNVDANGILNVTAKDMGTGKKQSIKVTATSGLNETEINKIIDESQKFKEDDEKRKKFIELKNDSESLIFTTIRSVEEYGSSLSDEIKESVDITVSAMKEALETDDYDEIKNAFDRLNEAAHKIAETIYSN